MLSPTECRAKAAEAFTRAASSTDPYEKLNWQGSGQEWAALAVTTEAHQTSQRDLVHRSESGGATGRKADLRTFSD
jgi:hypothetical protein